MTKHSFAAQLRALYPGGVQVVNDAQLVIPAAGVQAGLAVIVGTGSIVVGTSASGEIIIAGGHGWLLGDPGSAPAIVREAVRKVLLRRDDGLAPDGLARRLMRHFDVESETGLIYSLSTAPDIVRWAEAASEVFEASAEGSALANDVIDEAADGLANNVRQAIGRGAEGTTIVCAGGVITSQPQLFDALRARVRVFHQNVSMQLLEVAPVQGAVALAMRMDATAKESHVRSPPEREVSASR